jgi:hypothetical protein
LILFVYGTLLEPTRLARVGGVPGLRAWRPARLRGWRRVAMRGGGFPTLIRAFRAHVDGAIARIPAAALARLSAYEGPRYRFAAVMVSCAGRPVATRCWIAPAIRRPWKEA